MSHEDQGPKSDPKWRERFGLKPERPEPENDPLPKNPRNPAIPYVDGVQAREIDTHDYSRKSFINWRWLRVHRHFGFHFDEQEVVIEIRLPGRLAYNLNNGPWKPSVVRSYVIVFGRAHTRLARGSWHARGGMSTWNGDFL